MNRAQLFVNNALIDLSTHDSDRSNRRLRLDPVASKHRKKTQGQKQLHWLGAGVHKSAMTLIERLK